jgi:hypothetical protein
MKRPIYLIFAPMFVGILVGILYMPEFTFRLLLVVTVSIVFLMFMFVVVFPYLHRKKEERIPAPTEFGVRMHRLGLDTFRLSGNGTSVLAKVDQDDNVLIWRLDHKGRTVGNPVHANKNAWRFGKNPNTELIEYVKENMLKEKP